MWAWLGLSLLTVVVSRVAGPSDIDDKDQPKTIAYTVDMVVHGRWFLPRRPQGEKATKPPLYNWLDAPLVMATGRYDEWVFKLPSLVAGLATLAMTVWMTRRMVSGFERFEGGTISNMGVNEQIGGGLEVFGRRLEGIEPMEVGLLAGVLWLASPLVFRQVYLARPDGLLIAFLTGAWIAGTVALEDTARPRWRWSLVFWICVGGAALTKGPPALVPLLYVILAAKLIHGRFGVVLRLGWWWGLGLALGLFGSWLLPAYLLDRRHVVDVLMGRELLARVSGAEHADASWAPWRSVFYLVTRFLPWSVFAIVLMVRVRVREWFSNPLGPAFLWVLLVTGVFACAVGVIARYLAPAFVAMEGLAAVSLLLAVRLWRWRAAGVAACGYVVIVGIVVHHLFFSAYAVDHLGDRYIDFARQVRPIVGDEPVAFELYRRNPIPSLLGRHEGGENEADDAAVKWIIRPVGMEGEGRETEGALVVSALIRQVVPGHPGQAARVGLYRAALSSVGVEDRVAVPLKP